MPLSASKKPISLTIGRVSLADKAYDAVKRMIVTGDLAAGEQLVESQLALQLGISRSPLREALARLAEEGFLDVEPWKGPRVAPLTETSVHDLYDVRLALEVAAARASATRVSDDDLHALLADLRKTLPALNSGDVRPLSKLESAVHGIYVDNCGNALLQSFIAKLQDHIVRVRVSVANAPNFRSTASHKSMYREHEAILKALLTHDPDVVEAAVREHSRNATLRLSEGVSALSKRDVLRATRLSRP